MVLYCLFWCQSFGAVPPYVYSYYFSSACVAEWAPFGKELLTLLTICSHCILTICNFSYFPFWFCGLDLGSDCISSWSLYTLYTFYFQ